MVWYEPDFSVYVLRQASRRSWRIGQRLPVEVHCLVYQGTMQAQALALVAAKTRAALLAEGELPEEGLAALGGDGQDVLVALARQVVQPADAAVESLEALFAQQRRDEADDEGYLVDGGWDTVVSANPSEPADDLPRPTDLGDLWRSTFAAGPDTPAPASKHSLENVGPRVLSFDQLARLVDRPKRRARPVAPGQLSLFPERAA